MARPIQQRLVAVKHIREGTGGCQRRTLDELVERSDGWTTPHLVVHRAWVAPVGPAGRLAQVPPERHAHFDFGVLLVRLDLGRLDRIDPGRLDRIDLGRSVKNSAPPQVCCLFTPCKANRCRMRKNSLLRLNVRRVILDVIGTNDTIICQGCVKMCFLKKSTDSVGSTKQTLTTLSCQSKH